MFQYGKVEKKTNLLRLGWWYKIDNVDRNLTPQSNR